MKIQIAFYLIHHHNPFVNKDTENQIRTLIRTGSAPATLSLKCGLSAIGMTFKEQGDLVLLNNTIELLDQQKILDQTRSRPSLDIQWSIDSTNDYLMKTGGKRDSIVVCMACCMAEEAGLDCLRDGKALDLAACFEYFDELKADSAVAPSYGR